MKKYISFVAGRDPEYLSFLAFWFIFAITLLTPWVFFSQINFLLKQDLHLLRQGSLKSCLSFLFDPYTVPVMSAACSSTLWKCQLCRGSSLGSLQVRAFLMLLHFIGETLPVSQSQGK